MSPLQSSTIVHHLKLPLNVIQFRARPSGHFSGIAGAPSSSPFQEVAMNTKELETIARTIMQPGKGILAADESEPTIQKRFAAVQVESTEENRRAYRELLCTTPGIQDYISGVILFEETLRQSTSDDIRFPRYLSGRGILPGIKVDKGAKALAGFEGEKITEGLDGLRQRLAEYSAQGAKFAKWRAVIPISHGFPTRFGLRANAHALARYAALCQEAGLVPIVEPEVLMDGDHDIQRCRDVTAATLKQVYAALFEHCVYLEGTLLKPNMVLSGKGYPVQAGPEEVAETTLKCLRQVVPAAVPGIVFLSGGQSPVQATENLNAISAMGKQPWELSFSFGRALQEDALKAWQGSGANKKAAQDAFSHRARCNSAARNGVYARAMEQEGP
jgi:fructose-bisphosphate aldolase, class I